MITKDSNQIKIVEVFSYPYLCTMNNDKFVSKTVNEKFGSKIRIPLKLQHDRIKQENQNKIILKDIPKWVKACQKQNIKRESDIKDVEDKLKMIIKDYITRFLEFIRRFASDDELSFDSKNIIQKMAKLQMCHQKMIQSIQKKANLEFDFLRLKGEFQKILLNQKNEFVKEDYSNALQEHTLLGQKIKGIKQKFNEMEKKLKNLIDTWIKKFHGKRMEHRNNYTKRQNQILRIKNKLIKINQRAGLPKYPKLENGFKNLMVSEIFHKKETEWSTPFSVNVDQNTFKALYPSGWITSSIVVNYLNFLKLFKGYNEPRSKIFILNESEFGSLSEPASFYSQNVQSKYTSLFRECDLIGIVVNKSNTHWYFIGIIPSKFEILIYNSINQNELEYEKDVKVIKNYIYFESSILRQKGINLDVKFKEKRIETIQQKNGSDCGICTLINLTQFLDQNFDPITKKIVYEYEKIQKFRIGLHYFLCYLIDCKLSTNYINMDYLQYCTRILLKEPDWEVLL